MVTHVKYPSMERQDLTQSQLGAFKFTPVDEAIRSPQPQHHPFFNHQYVQSFQNAGLNRQLISPDVAADPAFFNHQIKPSLDRSRLQFGPAAVRAAVESASSSPQKQGGYRRQDPMRANIQPFYPQFYGSSENDSMPSVYTSEANSMPLTEGSSNGYLNHNNSLMKALEAEQEAHEATKMQFEQEAAARREAEAETQRLAEHNKGLLNSIKLLQCTVKHMVQKETVIDKQDTQDAIKNAVKEYKQQAKTAKVNDSILYDVLSNYKVPQKSRTVSGKESTSLINLDLLNTPDANDQSEKAQLQRTLRRQIGLCQDVEPKNNANTEYQQKIEAIGRGNGQLISADDDILQQENVPPAEAQNGDVSPRTQPRVQEAAPTPAKSRPDPEPILELPASFLSKYGKKPASREQEDLSHLVTPRKASLTVASAIKAKDFDKANKPISKTILLPDTVAIDWKVDGRHADELRGVRFETRTENHFGDHPVRYVPKYSDENLYRTVMIDFIPFGTPYSDLLAQIRGGTLESVQMYGPIGNATDFVTARIIFTDETGAADLYMRGQSPGIMINGKPVRVWQVLEPTYPKNKELEEAIYVHGHTRILIINAPTEDVSTLLKRKLRSQIEAGLVLDIGRTYDGVPMVEFTSIEEASKALNMLLKDRDFGGSDFDFDDDYCAAKYA